MERSKSVGIIAFKRDGRSIHYLLLHHGGGYWNFPKGHQEAGEDDLATAQRELAEETGITQVSVYDDFVFEYDYDFDTLIEDGTRKQIYRRAIFFLGEVAGDTVQISSEHIDFGWFDYETALKRLHYQNGQNCLKKAHQFLLSKQGFVL